MRIPRPVSGSVAVLAIVLAACSGATQPQGTALGSQEAALPSETASATPAPIASATSVPTPTPVPLPSPAPVSLVWQAHGPVTANTSTTYVAIHPITGDLWVGVPFENHFWMISPDGKYLGSWGAAGSGDGQFTLPDNAQNPDGFAPIAFAPDGTFFVGDTGNARIEEFDANRTFVRAWGEFGTDDGQFVQITSIATDGTTVYVGDGERDDIQAFDTNGTFLRSFGADGGFSLLALDSQGRIYATNPQSGAPTAMAIFGPDGTELTRTPIAMPGALEAQLTVDAAGNAYVPMEDDQYPYTNLGIVEIDGNGQIVGMFQGGADALLVTPTGDALYEARGLQLDTTQWTYVQKVALGGS